MAYTKDSNSCFSDSKATDLLNYTKKLTETSIPSLMHKYIVGAPNPLELDMLELGCTWIDYSFGGMIKLLVLYDKK